MFKVVLIGIIVLSNVLFVCGEAMIGPGKWKIYYISYQEGEINDIIIDLKQKMLNRTHYVYSGKITTHEPLDDSLGLKMDICKYVDGGCKQFQLLSDNSFVAFANKFAEENIKTCFEAIGVDPPQLPLGQGEFEIENFLFDVGQLPDECHYGRFAAECCAMRGNIPVGCILCECEFYEAESSDEDEDDDDECE